MDDNSALVELTASIVSSYIGSNHLSIGEIPRVIQSIYDALAGVESTSTPVVDTPPVPAVPVKRSIHPDYLVCLEDGRKFKSLKRHLRSKYNLSPEEYREKWGLPKDYPMVCPAYAASRSELAKSMGLGLGGRKTSAKSQTKAKSRGRPKSVIAEADENVS